MSTRDSRAEYKGKTVLLPRNTSSLGEVTMQSAQPKLLSMGEGEALSLLRLTPQALWSVSGFGFLGELGCLFLLFSCAAELEVISCKSNSAPDETGGSIVLCLSHLTRSCFHSKSRTNQPKFQLFRGSSDVFATGLVGSYCCTTIVV